MDLPVSASTSKESVSVRVKTLETLETHTETETAGNMRFCVLTCTVSPETSIFMQK